MDLYSLYTSIEEVIRYLEQVDPEAAQRARIRYACFESHGKDVETYSLAAAFNAKESCEDHVVRQLVELRSHAAEYARRDGVLAEDEYLYAEQNAIVARNAEKYYRAMFRGGHVTWNLRDRHMADTLDALTEHLGRHGRPAKIVVWAHNSHIGDARATELGQEGELNIG